MIIYLYVKTHKKTGLKYLGKTVQDPFKYVGSGVYWKRHLKKHGKEHDTYILQKCYSNESLITWGCYYSKLWSVTKSKKWANLKDEEGQGWGSGQNNILYIDRVKEKHKKSINSDSCKKKQKETRFNLYGDSNFNNRDKSKDTCLLRYGVDNALKTPESLEKLRQTNLEKRGVEYAMQSENVKEKSKNTCNEKYGVDNQFKRQEIKQLSSVRAKERNSLITTCPWCDKTGQKLSMLSYHFDNCIKNPNGIQKRCCCIRCGKETNPSNLSRHFDKCK